MRLPLPCSPGQDPGQSTTRGITERFPTADVDCSISQVLHFSSTRFCELCLKQKYRTGSTSQHSRCTDAFLYMLLCSKLVYKWTSNTCTRQRALTTLFGSWLGADELCPAAEAAQRENVGLLSCLALHQSMAMDGLGQCLYSSVYSDAGHRGTITQTPLELSFKITWRDSL